MTSTSTCSCRVLLWTNNVVMSVQVMDKKTACVVGAGAAGIAALKECIRQGFETVCFELDSDIGKQTRCNLT